MLFFWVVILCRLVCRYQNFGETSLHSVTTQNNIIIIFTTMRISNLIHFLLLQSHKWFFNCCKTVTVFSSTDLSNAYINSRPEMQIFVSKISCCIAKKLLTDNVNLNFYAIKLTSMYTVKLKTSIVYA
jgi:hypothetical protein